MPLLKQPLSSTPHAPRNVMAVVQYDGADYAGFQRQVGRTTIQGELEQALTRITQETAPIVGAGRTDAGVHARAQVISFKTTWARPWAELQRALNAVLPKAIVIQQLQVAAPEFHARRSAKARTYRYTINNQSVRSPLRERFAWHVSQPLDAAAMHAALQTFIGWHDFVAFGNAPEQRSSTVRDLRAARCWREVDWALVELTANAFLQGMVRRIVGALAQVGSGQMSVTDFAALLPARDKQRVKWKAPPQGLCLWGVEY